MQFNGFMKMKMYSGILVQLRITCPLRKPGVIDQAVKLIKNHPDATCLISASRETKNAITL